MGAKVGRFLIDLYFFGNFFSSKRQKGTSSVNYRVIQGYVALTEKKGKKSSKAQQFYLVLIVALVPPKLL